MVEITKQQERFCLEYIHNGLNGKQAYKVAYPKCKSEQAAEAGASRLLRNVKVQEYIKELQSEFKKTKVMSIEDRREWLSNIVGEKVLDKSTKYNKDGDEIVVERAASLFDKMKAIDMLNKMDGAYTENINANVKNDNPLHGMTTEELKEYAESLK